MTRWRGEPSTPSTVPRIVAPSSSSAATACGNEAVHLGEEDELLQPIEKQESLVARAQLDPANRARAGRKLAVDQLTNRAESVAEHVRLVQRVDHQLYLAGILDEPAHVHREVSPALQRRPWELHRLRVRLSRTSAEKPHALQRGR